MIIAIQILNNRNFRRIHSEENKRKIRKMIKITAVVIVKVMMKKIKIKKGIQILTKIKDKTIPVNRIYRNERS